MQGLLDGYEVQVVAISKDTVAQAAAHRRRDRADAAAAVGPGPGHHRAFGLVHADGLEFRTFYVLGIPFGWPVGFRQMAIPTTFLVDEQGVIRWVDQATDYRLRGDPARIRRALQGAFGREDE